MKKLSLKSVFLVLLGGLAWMSGTYAQTVPFTFAGTSPVALQMDSYGNFLSFGTYGTGSLSVAGAGTRLVWYPGKGAFRAGYVDGAQWNDANIGATSVAMGFDTTASNWGAVAIGYMGVASGWESFAGGQGNATQGYSTALGASNAWGFASTAVGMSTAYANFSFSACQATVQGTYAAAFGTCTDAVAEASLVIGQYNVGGGNPTTWIATDPIFEIGNGTFTAPSDALVVYKNGNAALQGTLTASGGFKTTPASVAATDIPMYTGN